MKHKSQSVRSLQNVIVNAFYFALLGLILTIPSVLCVLYKSLLRFYLKMKHGNNFYGMMDGDETIWAIQDKSLGQIITLFIHTFDEEAHGDVLSAFQRRVDGCMDLKEACPKLFCRRGYCLGYYYFFLDYEQTLTKAMRPYESVDDLRQLLCDYGSSCEPLGANDDGMMQLLIGTTPIDWTASRDVEAGAPGAHLKTYPVIVRTHHALGDGVSLNCLFIKVLMKNARAFLAQTYADLVGVRKQRGRSRREVVIAPISVRLSHGACAPALKYFKLLWALLRKERYAPPILRTYDAHILHGKPLSGKKNLVWSEDAHSAYVQKVKNVKRRLPNATFNSVILAAVAATINEYFHRHLADAMKVPKTITSSLVTLPQIPEFDQMVQVDSFGNICNIVMTNKYVICALKLPMVQQSAKLSAIRQVDQINVEINHLKASLDPEVLILCNRVIARLLPVPCVKLLMRGFNTTFGMSNLPGFARGQLWHGGWIQDLYFWIPNSIDIGIGLSIFSSGGRLEMGLIVDKAIIPDLDTTQQLLDRITQHIDEMDRVLASND